MGGAGGTNENQGKRKGGESTPWSSDRTLQPVVEGEEAVAQAWLGEFFGALRPAAVVQVEFLLRFLAVSARGAVELVLPRLLPALLTCERSGDDGAGGSASAMAMAVA